MKISRTTWFRIAAVAFILLLAGLMMIIGRGHTIYLDDKTLEKDGKTWQALYRIDASVAGSTQEPQTLYARERVLFTVMGQKATLHLQYMEAKGGDKVPVDVSIRIPYGMDGVIVNLPALLAGESQDVFMSEFITVPDVGDTSAEVVVTDEFAVTDI